MPCAHSNGIWVWQHQHLPRGFPEMNTNKYNHVNEIVSVQSNLDYPDSVGLG